MDDNLYESVAKYYKCFCTKTSDVKNYFGDESSFFFIGESGQTVIAYGKEDIERLIEEQFWTKEVSEFGNTLIAFNINIEKKDLVLCPKTANNELNEQPVSEVAVVVVANLKGIHNQQDMTVTKQLGRRFVQTFVIQTNSTDMTIKSTFFSYLVSTYGLLNANPINTTEAIDSSDDKSETNESVESAKELDFRGIADNIDKLIAENSCSDIVLSPTKMEANRSQLMPISVDEVFADSMFDDKRNDDSVANQIRCEQYLKDIWTPTNRQLSYDNDKRLKIEEVFHNHNNGQSFADVLRDNLQPFQRPKFEDKVSDIRVIANCGKSKFRTSGDRRYEFCGQQNITIMGAQSLEEFTDSQIVFVANIPVGYSKTDFKRTFETFGKVLSIKFVERIGVFFAFVYFDSKGVDEVMKAVVGYSNLFINGLTLKAERYKRRIPTNMANN